jgi:8-oxo-dGTP pyrophosphatase MutT (NUDIX family)
VTETPRQRATAIVERDGRVLLVRDKWRPAFMLPGGGIDEGESPEVAIERELREETTLTATAVQYLFTHDGKYNHHHVFSVQADGDVDIAHDPMVVEFAWWDGKADVPVHPHVGEILRKVRSMIAEGQNGGNE